MSHDLLWLLICKQLVEKQTYNNKNVFIAVTYVQGLYRIFLFLFQLAHLDTRTVRLFDQPPSTVRKQRVTNYYYYYLKIKNPAFLLPV